MKKHELIECSICGQVVEEYEYNFNADRCDECDRKLWASSAGPYGYDS